MRLSGWKTDLQIKRPSSLKEAVKFHLIILIMTNVFNKIDLVIVRWMNLHGHLLLRISMGIIFIWFGLLKVFGQSPVNDLVARTVYWFEPDIFIPFLGWWEVTIGICFLFHRLIRAAILFLFLQIGGTFLPLVILPEVCFQENPLILTIEGQYIVKNLLIISAALVIGGTARLPISIDNNLLGKRQL
jgi:uncharacterized membrane protein YkgB